MISTFTSFFKAILITTAIVVFFGSFAKYDIIWNICGCGVFYSNLVFESNMMLLIALPDFMAFAISSFMILMVCVNRLTMLVI
jgi:hypothetical protein